jgi:uncharacterized membrane protein
MQAKIMIPMLLLCAVAGCARSADAPEPSAPGSAGEAVPAAATDTPAQPQPQSQPRANASSGSAGEGSAPQGIRVGEPSPYDRRGPRNPAPGTGWHAFGNEPFWSVQARGGTLVFTTPEDQRGVTLLGRRVPSLVGTVVLGSGPRGEFHFGVTPGDCSDGMSDRSFKFNSTFIYDGVTYKGCAEPVEAP